MDPAYVEDEEKWPREAEWLTLCQKAQCGKATVEAVSSRTTLPSVVGITKCHPELTCDLNENDVIGCTCHMVNAR